MFLKILQNSQENTCFVVSFLIKFQVSGLQLYKKRLHYRCFPVNFAKLLRTPFPIEDHRSLLLNPHLKYYDLLQKKGNFLTVIRRLLRISERGSHWRCSVRNDLLKYFVKFIAKHPFPVSFFIKLQATVYNFS